MGGVSFKPIGLKIGWVGKDIGCFKEWLILSNRLLLLYFKIFIIMIEKKILISTWGDPEIWKETEYEYNGRTKISPTDLFIIDEVINPDKIIIITLDSIANTKENSVENYNTLIENVKKRIKKFLDKNGFNKNNLDIIVSYNSGNFEGLKIEGKISDFYYHILYELSKKFVNLLYKQRKIKLTVYFDITYGLNFTPVLTYRALRTILRILAYKYDVYFIILNSEPYKQEAILKVHEIEKRKVVPRVVIYKNENFIKRYNLYDLFAFGSAFMYAMPIWCLYFFPKSNPIEFIDKLFKNFESSIKFKKENEIFIERKKALDDDFENLVKIYLIYSILKEYGNNKNVFKISELEKFSKDIWDKPELISYWSILYNEFQDIKNNKTKFNLNGRFNCDENTKRNLIAHAGIDGVLLKKSNDNITINDKNFFETDLKNCLISLLPENK